MKCKLYIKRVKTVVVPVQIRIGNLLNRNQKRYNSIQLVRFFLKRLKREKMWRESVFKQRFELGTSQIRVRPDNHYMAALKWKMDGRKR
jgi:hypothetical protein